LCKLCNRAKSNLITLKTANELEYASYSLSDLRTLKSSGKNPYNKGISHLHKLLYFSILRADRKCEVCKSHSNELTMRKKIQNGPLIRSNLEVICSQCLIEKYSLTVT